MVAAAAAGVAAAAAAAAAAAVAHDDEPQMLPSTHGISYGDSTGTGVVSVVTEAGAVGRSLGGGGGLTPAGRPAPRGAGAGGGGRRGIDGAFGGKFGASPRDSSARRSMFKLATIGLWQCGHRACLRVLNPKLATTEAC